MVKNHFLIATGLALILCMPGKDDIVEPGKGPVQKDQKLESNLGYKTSSRSVCFQIKFLKKGSGT